HEPAEVDPPLGGPAGVGGEVDRAEEVAVQPPAARELFEPRADREQGGVTEREQREGERGARAEGAPGGAVAEREREALVRGLHGDDEHVHEDEADRAVEAHAVGGLAVADGADGACEQPPHRPVHDEDQREDSEGPADGGRRVGREEAHDAPGPRGGGGGGVRDGRGVDGAHARPPFVRSAGPPGVSPVVRTTSCCSDTGSSSSPAARASARPASSSPAIVAVASDPRWARCSTSRPAVKASTVVRVPTTSIAEPRSSSASASMTMRPSSITSTCSSRFETSSIRCVDSTTVRGCSL